MNNYSNFIPMRMRGQAWMIGNISMIKIASALAISAVFALLVFPFLSIFNSVGVLVVYAILFVIGQVLTWVPTSSGHSLVVKLILKFIYKISYNHFIGRARAQIFDIYQYKTDVKILNEKLELKFSSFTKNTDGSYSIITEKKLPTKKETLDAEELKAAGILHLKNSTDNVKSTYFVGFRVVGYDISYKSEEGIANTIASLHNALKTITVPHTLIKIAQPMNYQENINALNNPVKEVIERNTNEDQKDVQLKILDADIKRITIENNTQLNLGDFGTEINWFLVLSSSKLEEIRGLKDTLLKDFSRLKLNMTLLSQVQLSNVFISLYAPYISFNDNTINKVNSIENLLNFDNLEFFPNYVKVKPFFKDPSLINEETYMKVGVLKHYPTITPPFAWLYKLASSFDSLVMHNKIVDKDAVHKLINQSYENTELKRANTTNRSKKGEMDFLYNSFKLLSDSISSGNEVIFDSSIYTINYGFGKEGAINTLKSYSQSIANARSLGFGIFPLQYEQRKGFGDLFIKDNLLIPKLQFPLPAYCYAYGFPFINASLNDAKGIILGSTSKKEPFVFDMTKIDNVRKNHNMFILGSSGTGKSTFLKLLWMHLYGRGHKIFIIDPEAEIENQMLVRNLKGTYIDISTTPINPFIVNTYLEIEEGKTTDNLRYDTPTKASWLSQWFGTLFGWNDKDSYQIKLKTYLSNWISRFYDKLEITGKVVSDDTVFPSISEFYEYLKANRQKLKELGSNDTKKLDDIIEEFDINFINSTSIPAKIWNTKNTDIDMSKSYINSFNISKLMTLSNNVKTAAYMLLLDLANKEMWRNKIYNDNRKIEAEKRGNVKYDPTFLFLIFDEGHLVVDRNNPMTTSFLAETAARCRKYSTSLIVATQNVQTFTGDAEILVHSTRIINNCQYSMSLGLKENDIKELDKLWESIGGLTNQEREYLANASKGECIFSTSSQTRTQVGIDIGNDRAFKTYASFVKNDNEVKVDKNNQ